VPPALATTSILCIGLAARSTTPSGPRTRILILPTSTWRRLRPCLRELASLLRLRRMVQPVQPRQALPATCLREPVRRHTQFHTAQIAIDFHSGRRLMLPQRFVASRQCRCLYEPATVTAIISASPSQSRAWMVRHRAGTHSLGLLTDQRCTARFNFDTSTPFTPAPRLAESLHSLHLGRDRRLMLFFSGVWPSSASIEAFTVTDCFLRPGILSHSDVRPALDFERPYRFVQHFSTRPLHRLLGTASMKSGAC
jgi:hypothetical protein